MKNHKIKISSNKHLEVASNDTGMVPEKKHSFLTLKSITKELSDYKYALDESSEVVITNADFIINYVNDQFCNTTKYAKDELLGRNIKIIDSNYHSQNYFEELYNNITQGKIWKGELRNKTRDGSFYWVDVTVVPFLNEEKKPWQYVSIRKDITARKEAELYGKEITDALTIRNNDLEQFTYILSHNLRAPIASLLGLTNILSDFEIDEKEKRDTITGISQTAHKLDEVIRDLNNVLKVKNKSADRTKEIIRFSTLMAEIEIGIRQYFVNEQFLLTSDFTAVNEYYSIKSYFHSIFYNLTCSSICFRKPSETCVIEIKSAIREHTLILTFKDNGAGFDLTDADDHVFDIYKRFHLNVDGIGIGLFMVKTQVETLGGNIRLTSKKNVGTEIHIELPYMMNTVTGNI